MTLRITSTNPVDDEIRDALRERTTAELQAFQQKLLRINSPRAWAIRFHLVQELMLRYMMGE